MADQATTFVEPTNQASYDEDFFAWTQQQAARLRAGDLAALDLENLAEEIESVGNRDRSKVRSRLEVLTQHLLKWRFQPEYRCRSWRSTIYTQRRDLEAVLEDSPSLRRFLPEVVDRVYKRAREKALEETGVYAIPSENPFTLEQITALDWYPE